jgi:ribosomal protein L18E
MILHENKTAGNSFLVEDNTGSDKRKKAVERLLVSRARRMSVCGKIRREGKTLVIVGKVTTAAL